MSNFNWQTEDEVTWDDLEPVTETAVSRRHPWLTYVLIVVGVITAVALIFRQVNQRIEAATANATSDILASHNLVQQAGADQDVELFSTLLSGRDFDWVDAQRELVQLNGLFDRSALDLTWLPAASTAVTQADIENGTAGIEINPELDTAELTFQQDYAVVVGNGVTQTVQLKQTAVYRLGSQRWLYAPPDDEFWGEFETVSGAMLRLTYPARDSELAQRLAFDLDDKLEEMCRTLADLNCFIDYRLRVRWDSDPQSLLDAAQPGHALRSGSQLTLPTPTLVGLPVDEAGYQALYRGYATQLVGAAIAGLTDYECCRHVAYFQALLNYQLAELGLRPLSPARVDYERVVGENITIDVLDGSWRSADDLSGEDSWLAGTAVEFVRHELPDVPIASLQKQMNGRRSLSDWLLVAAQESGTMIEDLSSLYWSQRWQSFAFEQYQAGQEPPPIPLPAQDIYLLCTPEQREAYTGLYQYQLAGSEWSTHPLDVSGSVLSLSPLPDDEAFLSLGSTGEGLHTSLWQDGSKQLLFENETITFGQFDPAGQYLQVYGLGEQVISRLDWPACVAGECTLEALSGYPVWSPQGTDFIMLPAESLGHEPFVVNGRTILFDPLLTPSEWSLYRGNGQPPTADLATLTWVAGAGYAPFWLDESTFGFIWQIPLSSDNSRHALVLTSTTDELPRTILTEMELQLTLPDNAPSTTLSLRYATPHPQQPDRLFVVATSDDQKVNVFSYDLQTDNLQFLLATGAGGNHSLGFSPDGRFLVVTGPKAGQPLFNNPRSDVYLYDLDTDQIQTFAGTSSGFAPANTYDWSADGQWLVLAQENQAMALAAPAYDYLQFIPHDLGHCSNAVWMNQ